MRRERAVYALQVVKGYAQDHRAAHRIKPDSNATWGSPFDEHTPDGRVAWYFHNLACLGKSTSLNWILRGRDTPQAPYLQVRDGQWHFAAWINQDYAGRLENH